jgi:predicted Zn-dependent protease with MMP-like domain
VPFRISREEFEEAVDDAIDLIPDDLAQAMDNVAILVVEEYEPRSGEPAGTELLGLYEGTPLTERDSWWEAGSLPDRISIFRGPLMRSCGSHEELVEEILVTVVHEIAHHFGIDDERLHELGWG